MSELIKANHSLPLGDSNLGDTWWLIDWQFWKTRQIRISEFNKKKIFLKTDKEEWNCEADREAGESERERDRQGERETARDGDTAGDRRVRSHLHFWQWGNRLKSGEQREEFNCFHLVIIISKKPHERENLCFFVYKLENKDIFCVNFDGVFPLCMAEQSWANDPLSS